MCVHLQAKRVVTYLGRAKPEKLVDELMNELQVREVPIAHSDGLHLSPPLLFPSRLCSSSTAVAVRRLSMLTRCWLVTSPSWSGAWALVVGLT